MNKLSQRLKRELKKDIKKYDLKNVVELVNFFYDNYTNHSLDDFIVKCDRYSNPDHYYDFNKKINFIVNHRITSLDDNKLLEYKIIKDLNYKDSEEYKEYISTLEAEKAKYREIH